MTNPPVVLRTIEARKAADEVMRKLNAIQPAVFDYQTRNSLTYLALIAQEVFNDLKASEALTGTAFQKAVSDAIIKFETAYHAVTNLLMEQ